MIDAPSLDESDASVIALARSLPSNVRMAIATHRSVLSGPSLSGRVQEISEELLKFRLDEAVELLGHELDLETAERVWDAADGWLAAMLSTLTALARVGDDPARWLHGPGAERLFHDWFEAQGSEAREFLLSTAVLDDLEVGACNAISGRDDSAAMLTSLTREHCFVSSVRGHDDVYWQRHPLLTSFLRRRSSHTRIAIESHSRAADWFREREDVEATMRHLLAAGRTREAGAFLRQHEADLFRWGRSAEALDWYQQLPPSAHGAAVMQVLRVAWGHAYSAQPEQAETWLARLKCLVHDGTTEVEDDASRYDEAPEQVDREIRLEGETDVLEAYIATFHGDVRRMERASERAIAAFDGSTERDSEQLSHLLLVKGMQWSGDLGRARAHLDLLEHRPFANDMIRESTLASLRSRQARLEGRIHVAYRVADRALHWIEGLGLDPLEMRLVNVTGERAAALLERGDLAAAEPDLLVAFEAQRLTHRTGDAAATLIELARVRFVRGDAGAALRQLQQARAMLSITAPGSPMTALIDAAEARVRIAMGDGVRAERLIRGLPRGDERTLLWSRLSLSRGGDVRRTLVQLEPSTVRGAAELHLLRGWAMRRRGMRMAEAHLIQAADLAVENGLALLLTDVGPQVRDLADEVARRHSHDGLLWLLSVVHEETITPTPVGRALSPGEMRLITMLPTRDSNRKIAERLNVTENTVKTRLRRLYRKLDVGSRDEAIAVARSRGLL
jgi:LuxR family maltose regulon positive regulatory protein